MKTYCCVAVFLCAFVLVQCEIDPELKSKADECLKEFELSEESLKTPDFEDAKVKCFAACTMKKDDRLTDGKASVDKEVALAPKYMADKIDDSLTDKMTECVDKANEEEDDCAVAGALYKCVTEKFGPITP